jgi:restriction system protein
MAKRRGFFAEMQHQAQVAAREKERAQRQYAQAHARAVRDAERAQAAAERAAIQATRASDQERKRLERDAKLAHEAAMQADVDERNAGLEATYTEIDRMLAATLDVDDHVDLEDLRRVVEHPPFDRPDLEVSTPPPQPIPEPPMPTFVEPEPPKGLIGKKRRLEEARAAARAAHDKAVAAWEAEVAALPAKRAEAEAQHADLENQRLEQLATERRKYEAECAARDEEVAEQNASLDALIANLGYGTADAIEEYIGIVLSNSVYPEHFPVEHTFRFDTSTAELTLKALIPGPDKVPTIKAYRYVKKDDMIVETPLSAKAAKDRYTDATHNVALRTLHEVFEADRRGLIRSITLEVGTETIDPATGIETYVPLVAVGAYREAFIGFDLSAVVPSATLAHLGASVSKNPYGLIATDTSGVRRS